MAIEVGARIAHYEVTALIGEGGMGRVYQATDTKLNRQVALKILPEAFASDPDRLARFQREAQVLASLNHPNIGQIHGLEEANGTQALVLELIEGPTLADRIAQGAIPVDEALPIAKQIAEALEAAHEAGVIHRDLKPANIKIREDGTVKVLDFGLAKAVDTAPEGDPDQSPTVTAAATQMGVIMGTAAYMSPEQAKGRPVDKHADIWAFGVVLYEMVTGRAAFSAKDVSETLAAVLTRDLDLNHLPPETPTPVRRVVRRCLERNPKTRLHDIGDALPDLVMSGDDDGPATPGAAPFASLPARWLLAGLAVATVALGVTTWLAMTSSDTAGVTHASIALPPGHALVAGPEITQDGQRVAFASTDGAAPSQIYTRRLDETDLRALDGTEEALQFFFSPDGRWIAFYARGGFFKARVDGGEPVRLADASAYGGGHWLEDGTILFTTAWNSGLYRIDENGGQPEPFLIPDRTSYYAYVWPLVLPGGRDLLFTRWGTTLDLMRLDLTDMTETVLVPGNGKRSAYAASGHLVLAVQGGDVVAVPGTGPGAAAMTPELVLQDVDEGGGMLYTRLSMSRNGTLVYAPLDRSKRSLVAVDQAGRREAVKAETGRYDSLSLSPDGRRAAVRVGLRLFVHDLERGGRIPLTPEQQNSQKPVWSADGTRIFYSSNRSGTWSLYAKSASGAGEVRRLLERRLDQFPEAVAADGTLVYKEAHEDTGDDIWLLPPGGEPEPWRVTTADDSQARPSPSGHLMAFSTNASGRFEVSVQAFDGTGDPVAVSTAGGFSPTWSSSGDRLYFRQGHQVMVSEVSTEPVLTASVPDVVFDGGLELSPADRNLIGYSYAVMPDDRFLMIHHEPEALPTRINVIFNWFTELSARVPLP